MLEPWRESFGSREFVFGLEHLRPQSPSRCRQRSRLTGSKWAFTEGRNTSNPASHCDIAWAGALATHAHTQRKTTIGCAILHDDGTISSSDDPRRELTEQERIISMMHSNDPRIWQRVGQLTNSLIGSPLIRRRSVIRRFPHCTAELIWYYMYITRLL
jgi:hypothetical protein